MDYVKYLTVAGVPAELHAEAVESLKLSEERAKGLNTKKWKVRLFKAKKISEMLEWEDERLVDKHPELIDWDVAPMINITAQGDNGPWDDTPNGGRPMGGYWLNKDPESEEYKFAVKANYWKKGTHPRSKESRKAWYARNGGEGYAWRMGFPVDANQLPDRWYGKKDKLEVQVVRSGKAWIINFNQRYIGDWGIKGRMGFEVDNIFGGQYAPQLWYPIPNYELRAPVTRSFRPGKIKSKDAVS